VRTAPDGSSFRPGDLVVGVVRRPDPVPCGACAAGEWDMCRNGGFTEHGIQGLDGFCAEWLRLSEAELVPVPASLGELAVLVEPTSVVAKAWEQIERIGARSAFQPQEVFITGAGPIGLLAALLARQRGLSVRVADRPGNPVKAALVRRIGATFVDSDVIAELKRSPPDIALECTGAAELVLAAMSHTARAAITCLVGVSPDAEEQAVDIGALNTQLVLENDVVFGSVNANRRHYEAAAQALARAPRDWLGDLISRRVPLERWADALKREKHDVKVVIDLRR